MSEPQEGGLPMHPAALRRGESGRSRLLVGSEADFLPAGVKLDKSREGRTVLPVSSELLAGVDREGHDVPVNPAAVEASLDMYSVLIDAKLPQFAPDGVYCVPSWTDVRCEQPFAAYFKEWNSERDYLPLLLIYIKSIFFSKDLLRGTADKRNWRNETAAKLFRDDKAALLSAIQDCVKKSQEKSLEDAPKDLVTKAAAPEEEREPVTAASAVLQDDVSSFAFNFKPFHRHLKPLLHALSLLAVDDSCVDPTEAFVEWFSDDWCKAESEKEEKPTPQ
ncbi:hypothetical protein Emed_002993 [Eimeria media]